MASEACEALREIHIGRLKISDFAPPEVFSSGLFNQYPLTIADLRWHLTECDECGASMTVARDQLADFDLMRLAELGAALDYFQTALGAQLDWLKGESDFSGELVVRESEWDRGEPAARAGLAGFWSDQVFEENRDRFVLAAIRVHAFLGGRIASWLETLLPPAIPRARLVRDHEIVDVWIAPDRVDAAQVPDLSSLLTGDEKLATFLLRSLLLREAFGNLAAKPGDELVEKECATPQLLELQTEEIQGLRWRTVWEHYTELAQMKAERLCQIRGTAGPTDSRVAEQLETLAKKVEALGETTESLLHGQNAIMDSLERQEAVHRELLEAYRRLPAAIQDRCRATVELALGDLFGQLTDKSRACLLTGEWIYNESPPNLEFSGAIVEFIKAFEEEVRRSMAPLDERLRELIASDHSWKGPRRTSRLQLGHWAHLLEGHKPELESEMARLGLDYRLFADAIRQVNEYKGAKHTDVKSKADATTLRALFLGRPSLLAAVVRKLH